MKTLALRAAQWGAILLLFLLAFEFGLRWDGVAREAPGVTVTLTRGEVLDGALSRTWDGDFVLRDDAQGRRTIDAESIDTMRVSRTGVGGHTLINSAWRAWGPPSLVLGLVLTVRAVRRMRQTGVAGKRSSTS